MRGPQTLPHGNKLHIVYCASGCWTPYFTLGLLAMNINSEPMVKSSCTKSKEAIFRQSKENGVFGTGHNSFFKSPDGTEDWILYNANDTPADGCGGKRFPRAQRISWGENDMPVLGLPYLKKATQAFGYTTEGIMGKGTSELLDQPYGSL